MQNTSYLSILLLVSVLLSALTLPVSAENVTITFSDLDLGSSTQIQIYAPDAPHNRSLIGTYNATDVVSLQGETNYIFVLRPGPQHWFENPLNALEYLKTAMPTAVSYLLWVGLIIGLLFCITRVFK